MEPWKPTVDTREDEVEAFGLPQPWGVAVAVQLFNNVSARPA